MAARADTSPAIRPTARCISRGSPRSRWSAVGVAWGRWRARRTRRALARLVIDLGASPSPGGLGDRLALTLDDPGLRLLYFARDGGLSRRPRPLARRRPGPGTRSPASPRRRRHARRRSTAPGCSTIPRSPRSSPRPRLALEQRAAARRCGAPSSTSCAPRGRGSSPPPTASAGGSSAICTTAPSSASSRSRSRSGLRAPPRRPARARRRAARPRGRARESPSTELRDGGPWAVPRGARRRRTRRRARGAGRGRARGSVAGHADRGPLARPVESAAYFLVAEALRLAARGDVDVDAARRGRPAARRRCARPPRRRRSRRVEDRIGAVGGHCSRRRREQSARSCHARRDRRRRGAPARGPGAACSSDAGFEIAGRCGDADALLRMVEARRPDVALVDIRMPPKHTDEG